jgi:hypothetical protein
MPSRVRAERHWEREARTSKGVHGDDWRQPPDAATANAIQRALEHSGVDIVHFTVKGSARNRTSSMGRNSTPTSDAGLRILGEQPSSPVCCVAFLGDSLARPLGRPLNLQHGRRNQRWRTIKRPRNPWAARLPGRRGRRSRPQLTPPRSKRLITEAPVIRSIHIRSIVRKRKEQAR